MFSERIWAKLAERPLVVAITGPNGAGKSTFFDAHIAASGLPLINADVIAARLQISAYDAAGVAAQMRASRVDAMVSFAFETVFSDPVQEKLRFLQDCASKGYRTALVYIGVESATQSADRVALRVSQQGHDVPRDKLMARYDRTLENLRHSLKQLPFVAVYDNGDLNRPYQPVAIWENSTKIEEAGSLPAWYQRIVESL